MTPERKKELRGLASGSVRTYSWQLAEVLDALDEVEKQVADITKELVDVSNENLRLREVLEAAKVMVTRYWGRNPESLRMLQEAIARAEKKEP